MQDLDDEDLLAMELVNRGHIRGRKRRRTTESSLSQTASASHPLNINPTSFNSNESTTTIENNSKVNPFSSAKSSASTSSSTPSLSFDNATTTNEAASIPKAILLHDDKKDGKSKVQIKPKTHETQSINSESTVSESPGIKASTVSAQSTSDNKSTNPKQSKFHFDAEAKRAAAALLSSALISKPTKDSMSSLNFASSESAKSDSKFSFLTPEDRTRNHLFQERDKSPMKKVSSKQERDAESENGIKDSRVTVDISDDDCIIISDDEPIATTPKKKSKNLIKPLSKDKANENYRIAASKRGGICLRLPPMENEANNIAEWRCSEGHIFLKSLDDVEKSSRKNFCPSCDKKRKEQKRKANKKQKEKAKEKRKVLESEIENDEQAMEQEMLFINAKAQMMADQIDRYGVDMSEFMSSNGLVSLIPDPDSANPHVCLGLPFNASMSSIKKRFRELALKFHPDKNKSNEKSLKAFYSFQNAYETLTKQKR